jgi:hypothetical protein
MKSQSIILLLAGTFILTARGQNTNLNSFDPSAGQIAESIPVQNPEPSSDSVTAFPRAELIMQIMNHEIDYNPYPQRPFYNHTLRFGTGYSINTARVDQAMYYFNDTSEHKFQISGHSPIVSFSHYMALDSTFSLGYSFGYSQSDIYYDNQSYGSKYFFLGVNPMLHIFRRYNFEYYVKLNIGLSYEHNNLDMVHSERLRNIFPTGFHMFTGFTFAGVNYLINDAMALNAEFSIWSQETVNIGLTYRFLNVRRHHHIPETHFAY